MLLLGYWGVELGLLSHFQASKRDKRENLKNERGLRLWEELRELWAVS